MRKLKLLLAACALIGASAVWAQTDVTSQYLTNADFSKGTPVTVGVCTYAKDKGNNNTEYAQLTEVEGWEFGVENGDARAGGLVAFGSGVWIGGTGYTAPATNADGDATGNILGLVGVWGGIAQYVQNVTLPKGTYTLVLGVYNSKGGTTDFAKNLIGFIESGGTEHLASAKTYAVNTWKYEFISFTLEAETSGKISLGYTSANKGSSEMPHLFLSGIQLFNGEIDAEAYEAAKEAQRNAKELALNKEKLAGSTNASPSADLLVNGGFDTANQGWTLENMGYQSNQERPTRYVEKWQKDALTGSGSAVQTVKNLPAGAYVLTGTVHTNKEETEGAVLSVNETSVKVSGSWKEYEIPYNLEEDGDIAVSFTYSNLNSNWVAIDDFSLVYVGETYDEDVYQDAKLKKDWATANKAATDALADANYTNVTGDERTALQAEADKQEPSVGGYKTAIEALNAVVKTFKDAKASYDALVAANAAIVDLPYANSSLKPSPAASASSAEAAATAANEVYTALRKYYESNAKAEAVTGAKDMTNLIVDPNMEGVTIEGTTAGGWTLDQTGGTVGIMSSESFTDGDGNSGYSYFDYNNDAENNQNLHQVIEGLAPGRYLLSATGRGHANFNGILQLYVVGKGEALFPAIGNSGGVFGRGWNDVSLEFELSATSDITIGAKTHSNKSKWWSVTRFRLVQLEAITMADASDYAALNTAIETAEGKTPGFEAGEYAPYYNVEAMQALAAAKKIDQETENRKEIVNQITSTLTSATWTANSSDLDAVYDGTFAHAENNSAPAGWTMSNNTLGGDYHSRAFVGDERLSEFNETKSAFFLRFDGTNSDRGSMYYYGNTPGYTMPLKGDTYYRLNVDAANWGETTGKPLRIYITGPKGFDAVDQQINTENDADAGDEAPQQFDILFKTTDAGNYFINVQCPGDGNEHNVMISNVTLKKAVSEEVTVSADGYATYVSNAPLDFTNTKIKAYTAKVVEGNKVMLKKIDKVPAKTPVVLYCEGGKTETVPFAAMVDTPVESDLVAGNGGAVATDDGGYTNYILNNGKGIGFYRAAGQTVAKGRAYLHVANATDSRLSIVFDGDATGISEVKSKEADGAVYNLSGQRVKNAKKGLYIVGGKKSIMK